MTVEKVIQDVAKLTKSQRAEVTHYLRIKYPPRSPQEFAALTAVFAEKRKWAQRRHAP